jgi:hypothetical protein
MKQDIKALSQLAVERAVAAREAACTELTADQLESVSGGAGSFSYIRDPSWYGIWEKLKPVSIVEQAVVVQPAIDLGPDAKLEAGIAAGKLAF